MPFLDPTGGFAIANQLTGKFIQGHTFHIQTVTHDGVVKNRSFDDCDIHGPAILHPIGIGQIVGCGFDGPKESLLIASQYISEGAIRLDNCNFRNCRFHKISLLGSQQQLDKWAEGFRSDYPS